MSSKTNAERFIARADLTTILAFVDRLSTGEILLTFKGRSEGKSIEDTSSQQQRWIRRMLPGVQDLVADYDVWTDPNPPYESHVSLHFDD